MQYHNRYGLLIISEFIQNKLQGIEYQCPKTLFDIMSIII